MATAGNGGSLGTGDSSAAGIAGLTAALLAVAEVGGRSARDAYFLSELSADGLPMAIGVSAVLALLCTLGLSQWLRVHSPDRVAPLALLGAAASFVGLALIASVDRILASAAFYLLMTGVVPVVFTAFWSVINERFDPYTAKTVVAKLAAAGALGGVVGGVTADRTVALLGMPSVLIGLAVLMSIAAWTTRSVAAGGVSRGRGASFNESGFRLATRRPLLRQMALLMLTVAVVETFVDYALKVEAAQTFSDRDSLVRFFAVFYTACGVVGFLIQLAIRDRFLRRFGLAAAVAMLPASVALASSVGSLMTRIWGVALARGAESVASVAFFRGGFQLLYTPLPPSIQRPSKAWVDVASGSAGEVIGALSVFCLLLFLPDTSGVLFLVLAAIGSVIALFLIRRLHGSYVGQLGESLRAGRVSLRPEQALDATTAITIAQSRMGMDREMLLAQARAHAAEKGQQVVATRTPAPPVARLAADAGPGPTPQWVQELCSGDSERALRVLKLGVLTTAGATEVHRRSLVAHVLPMLAEASMASAVRKFLSDRGPRITGQLVDELSDPAAPIEVRSQLAVILGQFADPRAMRGVWQAADDDNFGLRVTSGRAAARIAQRDPGLRPDVGSRLDRELGLEEAQWRAQDDEFEASPWDRSFLHPPGSVSPSLEHVFTLLAIEHGRELIASALAGVGAEDSNLRGTALEFLESVIPTARCQRLFERISAQATVSSSRSREEIEENLLLSTVSLISDEDSR